jgi:hypothetical protein
MALGANHAGCVELLAIDRGRGMHDVEQCLADGYSTAGTPGTGLGAVRRMAREFDIYSVSGEGTVIMARVGSTAGALRDAVAGGAEALGIRFGAVSVALHGEIECGDSWGLATTGGMTAIMVADGLGHGPLAAQAAQLAIGSFAASPFDASRDVLERAHAVMCGTRGAAAACARIDPAGALSYAGIGNIYAALVTDDSSRGLVSHNGTLGLRIPRLQQFEYRRAPRELLIMHSDGVSARWNQLRRSGLLQRHPAVIAAVLYRDHGRARDDATIVVVD